MKILLRQKLCLDVVPFFLIEEKDLLAMRSRLLQEARIGTEINKKRELKRQQVNLYPSFYSQAAY
jgi:hypothetical protein